MSNTGVVSAQVQAASAPSWSSIGRKLLMAATGVTFIGFVTGHMIGNLQIFLGPEQLNKYAETLQHLGAALWVVRILLATFLVIHIWTGLRLYLENRSARPIRYVRKDTVQASISSRTMAFSGIGLLLYVVYHLLHFTLLVTNPEYSALADADGRFDVYSMVVMGFSSYWISGIYILASMSLALHINHAVPSFFQTIGLSGTRWYKPLKRLGNLLAVILFIGYISIPVSILCGLIELPAGRN
jgi:succinate dehydrogenase / fumarate reductase cytochrome b subunit